MATAKKEKDAGLRFIEVTGVHKPCEWRKNLWTKRSKFPRTFALAPDETVSSHLIYRELKGNPNTTSKDIADESNAEEDLLG